MAELTKTQRIWVAALRSDKYKQGKNRLKTVNENGVFHCCLGVAVELCPTAEWDLDSDMDGPRVQTVDGGNHHGLPPEVVFDWLDTAFIESENDGDSGAGSILLDIPGALATTMPLDLYAHNDNGLTFDQIADLIEYFGLAPLRTPN